MCLEPCEFVVHDRDGRDVEIKKGCGHCWQCRTVRVNDWIGRCIAEQTLSAATGFVTLTYGGDTYYRGEHLLNPKSQQITYRDIQLYLYRLRKATAGRVRYFCTAEMGPLKGRVHWHLILFFERAIPPNVKLYERYIHMAVTPEQAGAIGSRKSGGVKLWDEGFSFWEDADLNSFRYACKYILKDQSEASEEYSKAVGLSSQPPLGFKYFTEVLAPRYVEQELPLRDLFYSFPGIVERKVSRHIAREQILLLPRERPVRFMLRGQMARHYMDAYVRLWRERHGARRPWPQSELLDIRQDAIARRHRDLLELRLFADDRYAGMRQCEGRNSSAFNPAIYLPDSGVRGVVATDWNAYEAASRGW